jgi:hypothetical protein
MAEAVPRSQNRTLSRTARVPAPPAAPASRSTGQPEQPDTAPTGTPRPPGPPAGHLVPRPRPLPRRTLRRGLPPTVARPKGRVSKTQPPQQADPPAPAATAAAVQPPAAAKPHHALSLRGDYWEVSYGEHTVLVEDCRGLRYIALLLQRGTATGPIHAKELVALATGHHTQATELEAHEPVLDTVAQQQLVARLQEIAAERDRACATDDLDRAATLDDEYERIADQLSLARSPKGSRRGASFNHASERARKAVAKAISEAIERLQGHPAMAALATHLASAIRKGQWLSYAGHPDWVVHVSDALPRK